MFYIDLSEVYHPPAGDDKQSSSPRTCLALGRRPGCFQPCGAVPACRLPLWAGVGAVRLAALLDKWIVGCIFMVILMKCS